MATLFCQKLTQRPKNPFASENPDNNPFSNPGSFTYTADGFAVTNIESIQRVAWQDTEALFGRKVNLYTIDWIRLDVFSNSGNSIRLTEKIAGRHPFLQRLSEQIPNV